MREQPFHEEEALPLDPDCLKNGSGSGSLHPAVVNSWQTDHRDSEDGQHIQARAPGGIHARQDEST